MNRTASLQVKGLQPERGGSKTPFFAASDEDDTWTDEAKVLFSKYDTNGDGNIDEAEMGALLMAISDKFTARDIRKLFEAADGNGNGKIEFNEFLDWLNGGKCDASKSLRASVIESTEAMAPQKSLARALTENSSALEVLFNVYDKDFSHSISGFHFQECHIILQAALRRAKFDDDDEHMNADSDLESDRKEALEFMARDGDLKSIGLLDFIDWMRRHIPEGMSQHEFYECCQNLARILEESFAHDFCLEKGYIKDKEDVLEHLMEKLSMSMQVIVERSPKRSAGIGRAKSPWDEPPSGLTVDRLKAAHMMVMPLNMKSVKDLSWEVLCLPTAAPTAKDAGTSTNAGTVGDVWVAEVVRRVLMHSGKLKVESAKHYMYNIPKKDWLVCSDSYEHTFEFIQPGLGMYALLKTAAEFGNSIRWADIQHSLEGGVDMRLIKDDDVDHFNDHIMQMVLDQMEEDDVTIKGGDTREAKMNYAKRYLTNELEMHPGTVMAILLKLGIVDSHPSWEEFAANEE